VKVLNEEPLVVRSEEVKEKPFAPNHANETVAIVQEHEMPSLLEPHPQ
jgi:hypothetical protein